MKYKAGDIIEIQSLSFILEDLAIVFEGEPVYEDNVKFFLFNIEPISKKHHRILTIIREDFFLDDAYNLEELGDHFAFPEKYIKGILISDPFNDRFELLDL